jgi:hypothetical protein
MRYGIGAVELGGSKEVILAHADEVTGGIRSLQGAMTIADSPRP